jgi:predicted CoA-binding protein
MVNVKEATIAVVGVSENEEKYGFKIFRDMLREGLRVEGVNPKGGVVLGKKLASSVTEMDTKPDMVVTVVPPAITEKVIDECARAGIREVWMQPGSESEAAIRKAEKYGMKVTHHACIMVMNGFW